MADTEFKNNDNSGSGQTQNQNPNYQQPNYQQPQPMSLEQAVQEERNIKYLAKHVVNTDERFKSLENKLDYFIQLLSGNNNTGVDNSQAANPGNNAVPQNNPTNNSFAPNAGPVYSYGASSKFYEINGSWRPPTEGDWQKVYKTNTGKDSRFKNQNDGGNNY